MLSLNRMENIFFLNGITALLGWNAALGALDYFAYVWSSYNVYLFFPVPVFIAYALTCVLFHWLTSKFTYKQLIIVGTIGLNLMLALLLIISIVFKGKMVLGYWLTLGAGFFLGCFNNFLQLSFFGMINYFGMETVSRFTIGTAASGMMIILLRAIITAIFGDNQENPVPIIIYFCMAILFNFFDLWLNLRMFNTEEYKSKIENHQMTSNGEEYKDSILSNKEEKEEIKAEAPKSYIRLMWESFKATNPYPLFIFFNFVITFMLFPGLTLAKKTSLSPAWNNIVMLIMYNIGDLLGKFAGDFRKSFNAYSITFLFFCRLYFFYTIPLMDKSFTQEDHLLNNMIFPFFNQVLFSLTNGLVINGSFILSFEKAPAEYKKYAGVLGGAVLQFGIMIGSFLAIPFANFVNPDL